MRHHRSDIARPFLQPVDCGDLFKKTDGRQFYSVFQRAGREHFEAKQNFGICSFAFLSATA
jgi:hypothetical protein